MFGLLKEKLRKTLSIFSRKVEEEAEPVKKPLAEADKAENKPAEQLKEKQKEAKSFQEEKPAEQKTRIEEQKIKNAEPALKPAAEKEIFVPHKLQKPRAQEIPAEPELPKPAAETQKGSLFSRIFQRKKEAITVKIDETAEEAEKPEPQIAEPQAEKTGFFSKAKEYLTTKKLSPEKFEELFWDIELALLESNVAVDVVSRIKSDLKTKLTDRALPRDLESVIKQALKESLDSMLSFEQLDIISEAKSKKPFIIAFFGINGSGKTTTLAKVAQLIQKHGLSCVMAAGDTFRAAAIHQLEEHANKLKIKLIKHDYGADAAAVAFDAVRFAEKNNIDVVLIDTAGRLHSDTNLMAELNKIVRVSKPDLKIFVGESITGNDCIEQTQRFDEYVGIDGIILTKADVDEKGGTALSISYITKKPVIYIGTGQRYEDIKPFTKELVMENLGLS